MGWIIIEDKHTPNGIAKNLVEDGIMPDNDLPPDQVLSVAFLAFEILKEEIGDLKKRNERTSKRLRGMVTNFFKFLSEIHPLHQLVILRGTSIVFYIFEHGFTEIPEAMKVYNKLAAQMESGSMIDERQEGCKYRH